MSKKHVSVGINSLPPGPHMYVEDLNKFRDRMYIGQTIKARFVRNMDLMSMGELKPSTEWGAIVNNAMFRVRKVYAHQVELEYVDSGVKYICFATLKDLYMKGASLEIFYSRRVA